jgi:hypothetical protein
MHCYDDDDSQKPQLWSAYVHTSRRTQKNLRALTLGIYGGLGHHRYPGVGSGDVYEAWKTLRLEVYLTLTAANVGVEWNHDLGAFTRRIIRRDVLHHSATTGMVLTRVVIPSLINLFSPCFRWVHSSHTGHGGVPRKERPLRSEPKLHHVASQPGNVCAVAASGGISADIPDPHQRPWRLVPMGVP